jgi:hypothetical protein
MTTPERVAVSTAELRSLTGAELFGALAHAHLTRAGLSAALEALQDPEGDPDLGLAGMRFLQAVALELALRNGPDPAPTWTEAQRWDVTADLAEDGEDPLEADRREYRVAAAIATGLAPDAAEGLAVVEVEALARRRAGVAEA